MSSSQATRNLLEINAAKIWDLGAVIGLVVDGLVIDLK